MLARIDGKSREKTVVVVGKAREVPVRQVYKITARRGPLGTTVRVK